MDTVASVAENSSIEVCVTMTDTTAKAILSKEVVVALSSMSDTGMCNHRYQSSKFNIDFSATTEDGDIFPMPVHLTFAPGSNNGTEVCSPLTAYVDNFVETEEILRVTFTLVTPKENFFSLGNMETAITIIDINGE